MKEFIKKHKIELIKIVTLIVIAIILLFAGIKLFPIVKTLANSADREQFQMMIADMGFMGWLYLLGIQILQIVIAIIPGEPVEILAGMLYGTVGGFLTCELGILIGSVLVFYGVKIFGYSVVTAFIPEGKMKQYKFLQNSKKLELLTFILFFIPGTPKDVLTYFIGFTPIKPIKFFLIATVARIPSVLTSTMAGNSIISGNPFGTVLIFGVVGILAIIGIYVNNKLMKKVDKQEEV